MKFDVSNCFAWKHVKKMSYTLFVRIIQTSFCQSVGGFSWKVFGFFLPLQTNMNKVLYPSLRKGKLTVSFVTVTSLCGGCIFYLLIMFVNCVLLVRIDEQRERHSSWLSRNYWVVIWVGENQALKTWCRTVALFFLFHVYFHSIIYDFCHKIWLDAFLYCISYYI
jgi:hypothetical protein